MKLKQDGFTLIEVLVAIVILAISLAALLHSTQSDIVNTNYLLEKNVGLWIADNTASEVKLGIRAVHPSHDPIIEFQQKNLNQTWKIKLLFQPTGLDKYYLLNVEAIKNNKVLATIHDIYYEQNT